MIQLRTLIALALVLALATTACSSNDVTISEIETVTVAAVDTAVRDAASALLGHDSVPVAVIYFDAEDQEKILRYDWIDYRSSGQALAVYNYLEGDYSEGFSLDSDTWLTASTSPTDSRPWQTDASTESAVERLPALNKLTQMSEQGSLDPIPQNATKQTASNGSELWALATDDDTLVYEWIISPDGVLNFHRIFSSNGLQGGAGTIIYEYGILDENPGPIVIPEVGTPMVLDDLEIPDALRSLGQSG